MTPIDIGDQEADSEKEGNKVRKLLSWQQGALQKLCFSWGSEKKLGSFLQIPMSFIVCRVSYKTIFLLALKAETFLQTTKLGSKQYWNRWVCFSPEMPFKMGQEERCASKIFFIHSTIIIITAWKFLTPFMWGDQKQFYHTHGFIYMQKSFSDFSRG